MWRVGNVKTVIKNSVLELAPYNISQCLVVTPAQIRSTNCVRSGYGFLALTKNTPVTSSTPTLMSAGRV